MKKTVEVKKCCWICQHFRLADYYEQCKCEKGHEIDTMWKTPWEQVCEDFELREDIKVEEVRK